MTKTAAPALGAAWAAMVLLGAARRRPGRTRLSQLDVKTSSPGGERRSAVELLGALVLTRVWRTPEVSPAASRRAGGVIVGVGLGLAVWPPLVPALALAAWGLPILRQRSGERHRLASLEADLPDVVDLFNVAVGAGLTVPLAVSAVARWACGPIGPELQKVADQARLGERVSDALDTMAVSTGDVVRPLVAALTDCDRYGAPLVPSLDRLAAELRRASRVRAEGAARKVPVKLLFPLVLCVLPAFALLTVAPLIASAARSLRL